MTDSMADKACQNGKMGVGGKKLVPPCIYMGPQTVTPPPIYEDFDIRYDFMTIHSTVPFTEIAMSRLVPRETKPGVCSAPHCNLVHVSEGLSGALLAGASKLVPCETESK